MTRSHTEQQEGTTGFSDQAMCELSARALEKLPCFFFIVSVPDYTYVYMNPAAFNAMHETGIENPSGAIGKHPWDVFPNWKESFLGIYEKARLSGEAQTLMDYRCEGVRGTSYWDIVLIPNADENTGEIASISTIGTDTTDRKRTEDELRESEKRYRLLFQNMSEGFALCEMIWDEKGTPIDFRYLALNRAWEKQTGLSMEDTVGCTVREIIPGIEPYWIETYARVVQTGEPIKYENCVSDLAKWFEVYAFKHSENRFAALFLDVTVRKQTEQALEAERARLRTVLDTLPVGVGISDAQGRVLELNDAVREIWGGRAPLPSGMAEYAVYKAWWPDTGEPLKPRDWPTSHVLRTGEPVSGTIVNIERFDGTRGTVLLSEAPLKDAEGRLTGVVSVVQDVTELVNLRRKVEHALEREQHFSRMLQRALLPAIPSQVDGYPVASIYVPAFASREIGGDFYDVFSTEAGQVAITIGDVSGKGLEAASMAAATRSSIRAFGFELSQAGASLTHANRVLYDQQPDEETRLFVTVALAILDLPTGDLHYSSAGHPPPAMYHRADRSVEFLTFGNLPMGIVERFEFEEAFCHLEPGDSIVFYTDGLSEAKQDSELFGQEGIAHVLAERGHLSVEEIADGLLEAAQDRAGGRLMDDTAIIVVARAEDDSG